MAGRESAYMVARPVARPFFGLEIRRSPYMPDGTIAWLRGNEVIGIQTKERADFLALFGFAPQPPESATGIVLSFGDYTALLLASDANAG